jgi:hypothetical protein
MRRASPELEARFLSRAIPSQMGDSLDAGHRHLDRRSRLGTRTVAYFAANSQTPIKTQDILDGAEPFWNELGVRYLREVRMTGAPVVCRVCNPDSPDMDAQLPTFEDGKCEWCGIAKPADFVWEGLELVAPAIPVHLPLAGVIAPGTQLLLEDEE